MNPKQLLDEVIPKKLAELAGVEFPDLAAEVQVTIDGEHGGTWVLHTKGGKPQIISGTASNPVVCVKTNRSAFDMGFKRAGAQALEMDITGPLKMALKLIPDSDKIEMVRQQLNGTLMFKIVTDDGDALIGIGFNCDADIQNPACTIETSEGELREMQEGKMPPQQAFMAGKIRLSGDMSIAMTAGMLLAPMA